MVNNGVFHEREFGRSVNISLFIIRSTEFRTSLHIQAIAMLQLLSSGCHVSHNPSKVRQLSSA